MKRYYFLSPDIMELLKRNGWRLSTITKKGKSWYTVSLRTRKNKNTKPPDFVFISGRGMKSFVKRFCAECEKWKGKKADREEVIDVGLQMEEMVNRHIVTEYAIYNYKDEWKYLKGENENG